MARVHAPRLIPDPLLLGVLVLFFAANTAKLFHGGWLPLAIAGIMGASMLTWRKGRRIVMAYESDVKGPLTEFIRRARNGHLNEVPGTAVYPHPSTVSMPLALSENAQFNRVIHEKVFIAHGSRQRPAHGTSGRSHGGSHGCGVRSHHPVDPALRVPGRPGRPRRPADRA